MTYEDRLDEVVRRAARARATPEDIVRAANGAVPEAVDASLKRIGRPKGLSGQATPHRGFAYNPELHPLDYEWYFRPRTSRLLAAEFRVRRGASLYLGAPTVAAEASLLGADVTLLDKNPLIRERMQNERRPFLGHHKRPFRFIAHDLADALSIPGPYELVLFDAPWYPEVMRRWLAVAVANVKQRGVIAMVVFRDLLRASAEWERRELLAVAETIGRVSVERGVVEYDTPFFEHEALASAGLNAGPHWRVADLAVIRVEHRPASLIDEAAQSRSDNRTGLWDTHVVDRQVVKLRKAVRGIDGNRLERIDGCSGFTLPTVSARDPRRELVDIWTSRNRVARVGNGSAVRDVLRYGRVIDGRLVTAEDVATSLVDDLNDLLALSH